MEKEQIIKALEWCSELRLCVDCPMRTEGYFSHSGNACRKSLMENALALIKQQDEQIFQLENRLKECENGYSQTLGIERARIKELTEENERLKNENEAYSELEQGCLVTGVKKLRADTVREIFSEIYSSLDYIEEQMEPEEIPECFFSVREDIEALKIKFEREGKI